MDNPTVKIALVLLFWFVLYVAYDLSNTGKYQMSVVEQYNYSHQRTDDAVFILNTRNGEYTKVSR